MDVVGYFKTSSALAKWKLRPAQPENNFMSVDGGRGFSYSNLPPEASMLFGAVLLISWFYRQRDFQHQSSPLRGILQLCYMRATEFPFRFSRFSSFIGLRHDSIHNKPSHYLFFRACFANIRVKLTQHRALIHLDWMMMHFIFSFGSLVG